MTLENLVRIKQLNSLPPDKHEFEGLIKAATKRLNDAENEALAYASRFDLAYGAAHGNQGNSFSNIAVASARER